MVFQIFDIYMITGRNIEKIENYNILNTSNNIMIKTS